MGEYSPYEGPDFIDAVSADDQATAEKPSFSRQFSFSLNDHVLIDVIDLFFDKSQKIVPAVSVPSGADSSPLDGKRAAATTHVTRVVVRDPLGKHI